MLLKINPSTWYAHDINDGIAEENFLKGPIIFQNRCRREILQLLQRDLHDLGTISGVPFYPQFLFTGHSTSRLPILWKI